MFLRYSIYVEITKFTNLVEDFITFHIALSIDELFSWSRVGKEDTFYLNTKGTCVFNFHDVEYNRHVATECC